MAVAGKVAITPKGAWDSTVLYDKLSLVTHENAIYIAKEQSQGVVPVDGEYWMFCMQNAGAEDIQNIVNGTTVVGKATNDSDGNKISETYMKKILELSETDVSDETELVSYEKETPKKRTSVKMWEYIKGKIDSVLGIKGISNNVVTTESGYAVDARQLNETVEGSYAKGVAEDISKINADLLNIGSTITTRLVEVGGDDNITVYATICMQILSETKCNLYISYKITANTVSEAIYTFMNAKKIRNALGVSTLTNSEPANSQVIFKPTFEYTDNGYNITSANATLDSMGYTGIAATLSSNSLNIGRLYTDTGSYGMWDLTRKIFSANTYGQINLYGTTYS